MKVFVEAHGAPDGKCWFRLVFPRGSSWDHEGIPGYLWTRAMARQALDLLEVVYHLPRRKVRFVHR